MQIPLTDWHSRWRSELLIQEIWFYKVYKKRNPTLILYNSNKTNFYSFILASLFSLIFCLFNEGHLFVLSKEQVQQK